MAISVAVASFDFEATQLRFESEIVLQHFETDEPDCPIEAYARTYPFHYASDDIPDLARSSEMQYPDPLHTVGAWARSFLNADGPTDTWDMLGTITKAIQRDITYLARDAEGIQAPETTLLNGSGSCRDLALLMMEAVRALGFAARFVSGYLYVPNADGAGNIGGGATHAWLQVYLTGIGLGRVRPDQRDYRQSRSDPCGGRPRSPTMRSRFRGHGSAIRRTISACRSKSR